MNKKLLLIVGLVALVVAVVLARFVAAGRRKPA